MLALMSHNPSTSSFPACLHLLLLAACCVGTLGCSSGVRHSVVLKEVGPQSFEATHSIRTVYFQRTFVGLSAVRASVDATIGEEVCLPHADTSSFAVSSDGLEDLGTPGVSLFSGSYERPDLPLLQTGRGPGYFQLLGSTPPTIADFNSNGAILWEVPVGTYGFFASSFQDVRPRVTATTWTSSDQEVSIWINRDSKPSKTHTQIRLQSRAEKVYVGGTTIGDYLTLPSPESPSPRVSCVRIHIGWALSQDLATGGILPVDTLQPGIASDLNVPNVGGFQTIGLKPTEERVINDNYSGYITVVSWKKEGLYSAIGVACIETELEQWELVVYPLMADSKFPFRRDVICHETPIGSQVDRAKSALAIRARWKQSSPVGLSWP